MAQLFTTDEDDKEEMTFIENKWVLFSAPRDAFVFDDVPYTRDHALRSTFHHEMMISDEMMPDAWRN